MCLSMYPTKRPSKETSYTIDMSEQSTTRTTFNIEAKDRQGNWHPWRADLTSRPGAESELAASLEKMSNYYTEAKIVQVDHKTTITTKSLKHIDIFA